MVFEAKNELEQYLSSINPVYAKYTECLWAKEVNSAAQLGNASVPVMHACGVENPVHAGDIIAQSKATGKWSYFRCSITSVCAGFPFVFIIAAARGAGDSVVALLFHYQPLVVTACFHCTCH